MLTKEQKRYAILKCEQEVISMNSNGGVLENQENQFTKEEVERFWSQPHVIEQTEKIRPEEDWEGMPYIAMILDYQKEDVHIPVGLIWNKNNERIIRNYYEISDEDRKRYLDYTLVEGWVSKEYPK